MMLLNSYFDKKKSDKDINISFHDLFELPSLLEFNKLLELNCGNNRLKEIPDLPPTLRRLDCSVNFIVKLPNLPHGLTYLNCSDNNLYVLHDLPSTLKKLLCSHNDLTELPELPSMLDELDCSNNQLDYIEKFPSPSNLKNLNVSYNQLKKLPRRMPTGLIYFNCSNNQLTSLPSLTNLLFKLKTLNCEHNKLTILPSFAIPGMQLLCSSNPLIYNSTKMKYIYQFNETSRVLILRLKMNEIFIKKFIKWIWINREKSAMIQMHPTKIVELLDNGVEIDDLEKHL